MKISNLKKHYKLFINRIRKKILYPIRNSINKIIETTCNLINRCEIDLKNEKKTQEMCISLNSLISILFAIVFAVGLSELNIFINSIDTSILILGYIAVLLSWWGYHYGTIILEKETNILNYVIDVGLLFIYWFLINRRESLHYILLLYSMMFFLYFLWELIRFVKYRNKNNSSKEIILISSRINIIFTFIVLLLFVLNMFICESILKNLLIIIFLYFLVIGYRFFLHSYTSRRK